MEEGKKEKEKLLRINVEISNSLSEMMSFETVEILMIYGVK